MQKVPRHSGDSGDAVPAVILDDDEGTRSDALFVRRHREMLALACGIIVLSFLLVVRNDEHAAFILLPNWPIPTTCPSQTIFHVDCPGCGLTRSFIFLAHGNWHEALLRNRMGWLVALAVIAQIPYRIVALLGRNRRPLGRHIPDVIGIMLIVALIGNWALKMFGL